MLVANSFPEGSEKRELKIYPVYRHKSSNCTTTSGVLLIVYVQPLNVVWVYTVTVAVSPVL